MKKDGNDLLIAPTDLSNFLSCRHQTRRDLDAASGQVERPMRYGPLLEELQEKGRTHEKQYLEYLAGKGLSIARITSEIITEDVAKPVYPDTLSAMRSGADIIYQAPLKDSCWSGRADFLRKTYKTSKLGDWSYEVIDTKLARDTKAGTILQLCVYTHLLGLLQGVRPDTMYVVTPNSKNLSIAYRTDDYAAYFRLLQREITKFLDTPDETYPEPVSHCDFCNWWTECEIRRRDDDHLGYVAGITTSQIESLRELGINRLAELANISPVPTPSKGSQKALELVRDQARVQLKGREEKIIYYELKDPAVENFGLSLLPEPTPDDIFLDFEGSHFTEFGVEEYLTGFLAPNKNGEHQYTAIWAKTLEDEKQAFEYFIEVAIKMREKNPVSHIYHFSPYEPAALKRLMGRYATCEVELDTLLRANVFIDLHAIVKRSLVASVERYSIKDLEPFFGYQRKQDLAEASMSRRFIEQALETGGPDDIFNTHCMVVEDYNREDCESTQRLRDWLEIIRSQVVESGTALSRPATPNGDASEAISELDQQLQNLRNGLLEGVPVNPEHRTNEQHGRFLLAHIMEFHRREDKASWWEYFRLLDLGESEYTDEKRAITGLQFINEVQSGRAPIHRYHYPGQELDARPNDDLKRPDCSAFGKVHAVRYGEQTIDIKKRMDTANEHAHALILYSRVSAKVLQQSLIRMGEWILQNGFNAHPPYQAATELLLGMPSPLVNADGTLQNAGETTVEAACRLAKVLPGHVLAIQGPPGTGKTYTGAHIICALKQQGLKVGVTAVSHKVIVNLLEGAMNEAKKQGIDLRAVHRQDGIYEGKYGIERKKDYGAILSGLDSNEIDVLGATAWCWSRNDFEQVVDVLIVDEAGQMSLSNVLAVTPAGRGLVLLGDPQQLEQPLQSSHPQGSEVSALAHFLGGEKTIRPEKGLFLEDTYRMHPEISRFTSEVFYQGRVQSRPELSNQKILTNKTEDSRLQGSGLRFVPVNHKGNKAQSLEEVSSIALIVSNLLENHQWKNKDGEISNLSLQDILIVTPYNAQVSALVEAIPDLRSRIGTVDRFQGQESPIVIYSMTSSSSADAPHGMEFLYDPHRFNVATSRAMAMCILVGSPRLFEPECTTPSQMKMANVFCRYLELASTV